MVTGRRTWGRLIALRCVVATALGTVAANGGACSSRRVLVPPVAEIDQPRQLRGPSAWQPHRAGASGEIADETRDGRTNPHSHGSEPHLTSSRPESVEGHSVSLPRAPEHAPFNHGPPS
jgi:hypothetical protein